MNRSGLQAAAKYDFRPYYWVYDWQTDEMTARKYRINADERFYKQEYCGCVYSLRDSNIWRRSQGIDPIKIGGEEAGLGSRYYENPTADAEEESQEVVDAFFESAERHFDNRKVYEGRRKSAQRAEDNGLVRDNNW